MNQIIIKIDNGALRGRIAIDYRGGKYYSFQGIPYATPPLGELRFKAPLPPSPWSGIKDVRKEGNVSRHESNGSIIGSEDCLYLNVYTPKFQKEDNKNEMKNLNPVIFWLHGGLCMSGSGNTDLHGPDYLMTEDVILVTTNYRLGVLGFLNLEDASLGVPGNAAMKDAVMALNWVQKNIIHFNGDPQNITLAGHSAGSGIAHHLMLSPMTKGLFHRIILQGGCALSPWVYGSGQSKIVAKVLGCLSEDEADILQFLQSVPVDQLLEAQEKSINTSLISELQLIDPVIEHTSNETTFLPQHPVDLIQSGNYNKVPMMIGYGADEGFCSEFIYKEKQFENFTNFKKCIPHYFNIPENSELSKEVVDKIVQVYFEDFNCKEARLKSFYKLQTDCLVLMGQYFAINMHIKNLKHPIYFYRNSYDTSLNVIKQLANIKMSGNCHGDELGYLFKNVYSKPFEEDDIEARCVSTVIKLWANFARYGDPNGVEMRSHIDVIWKPVQPKTYNFLDINTTLTTGLNPDIQRMKVWEEIIRINTYDSKFRTNNIIN